MYTYYVYIYLQCVYIFLGHPVYYCSAKNLCFQFTKIEKKTAHKFLFYFHIYYSLRLVNTFKLSSKKSDALKRRQIASKVENMRKSGIIINFKFFECIF